MIVFAALVADSKPEPYKRISCRITQHQQDKKEIHIHRPLDLSRRETAPVVQADFQKSFLVCVEQIYSVESFQSS